MELRSIDAGSPDDIAAACELLTLHDREILGPNEPKRPASLVAAWFSPMPGRLRHAWFAMVGDEPVGLATLQLRTGGGNDHLGWVRDLFVRPDARRAGVGSALLARVREVARADGRSLITMSHVEHDPAADGFAYAHELAPALVTDQRRLELASWSGNGSTTLPAEFEYLHWDDRCPDALIDAYCAAHSAMSDAPRSASTNAWEVTPDEVRTQEQAMTEHGGSIWVVAVRRIGEPELVGYSELWFEPGEPWLARQGDTSVDPRVRRRGLARAMKATNLRRLAAERPLVRYVETFNAADNVAMIALNDEIGFRLVARRRDREGSV